MTKRRVAILISGGGSNMVALAEAAARGDVPAEIVLVLSDKADAGGLAKAAARGIPTAAFERRDHASKAEHEAAILAAIADSGAEVICLAGYMRLLSADFIRAHEGRILNIHPSLLPLFPGLHTHDRALAAGMRIAGCTVHLVTEGMDEGPILAQGAVPILPGDTAETLAARVLTVEHRIYATTLAAFLSGSAAAVDDGQRMVVV